MTSTTALSTDYLIVGGGPAGLGAALRLQAAGADWHLVEAEPVFGGLSASFVDDHGFTWDYGGHVLFSHYDSFDQAVDRVMGRDGWLTHQRESWIWMRHRFIPYPFQFHFNLLDDADRATCLCGLEQAVKERPAALRPTQFGVWMVWAMGEGIADVFLRPYNRKVWAWPPAEMACDWVGERVAVPDLDAMRKPGVAEAGNRSWGPNNVFRFPRSGGTGAIWRALGQTLPASRVSLSSAVVSVDPARHTATTAGGPTFSWNRIISTMPLDDLIRMTPTLVEGRHAALLRCSASHVVGVGLRGQPPEAIRAKSWMYFPESHNPYYRVTVFSNYSPHNVPDPAAQWSLMTETASSGHAPIRTDTLAEDTVRALLADGLMADRNEVISVTVRHVRKGYPTPFLGRDAVVDPALRRLEAAGIYSRGRFGAWKYEVGNQDHSFAQGRECAERLLKGGGVECEPTLFQPALVNSRRNP